jgi:hypothetical protein
MPLEQNFFYSNLFIALVTIVVGLFGFLLYLLKNADVKRRTARIIMLEITNAEAQLHDARNRLEESDKTGSKKLPEHLYLMPLDTWTSNRHLFVNDFKTNEWEALNHFYNKCRLFDEAIEYNDSRFSKDEQQIRETVHRVAYETAIEMFDTLESNAGASDEEKQKIKETFRQKRDRRIEFLTSAEGVWLYTPRKELRDVEYIIGSIESSISTSSVGIKLSKLAKSRLPVRLNKR